MDGKRFKLYIDCHHHNKGGARVHDRISELPEEVIVFILSFVSVKEAAATSLLSRRWTNLWRHIPHLNFSSNVLKLKRLQAVSWDAGSCEYVKLVNSVLHSHRPPFVKLFKISFYVNRSGQSHVEKWLDLLLSRRVERLVLDLRCWEERRNKVVLGDYLLKIRHFSDIILFKSLKLLSLKSFQLSGEDIKMLLHSCPLLNKLIIIAVTLTSDVEICGENVMLKALVMYSCSGTKCIKVSAPNLTYIRVDDYTSGKLMCGNVGKLYQACFVVRRPGFAQHFASQVSCFISQLQYLTLALHHAKEFLEKEFPQMPNLSKLVVEDRGDYEHGGFLHFAALIWASPRLQVFHLKFPGKCKDSALPHTEAQGVKNVKRNQHRNLKTFKLEGCCRSVSDHVVELATYISKNCRFLKKIIIGRTLAVSSNIRAEVEARDSIKLQLQPKLGRHIHLQISRPTFSPVDFV